MRTQHGKEIAGGLRNSLGASFTPWIVIFVAINLACPLRNGVNVYSRWATLASMAEDRSYAIDNYVSVTADWSRTPDGRYYSNKPPGPMLAGFPLFLALRQMDHGPRREPCRER
jgi:hypothetical protein